LTAAVVFLLLPIIPLTIASVIVMVLMRFTAIVKKRDAVNIIGGVLIFIFAIGINVVIRQPGLAALEPDTAVSLGESMAKILDFFPGAGFASLALTGRFAAEILLDLGLLLVVIVLYLAFFMFWSDVIYISGASAAAVQDRKARALSKSQTERIARSRGVFSAILSKEFRILLRTPAFFLQNILGALILPALAAVMIFMQDSFIPEGFDLLAMEHGTLMLFAGVVCSGFISSSMNSVCCTAISREGENFNTLKYFPVSIIKQLDAKIAAGVILCMISNLLMVTLITFVLNLPLYITTLLVVCSIPSTVTTCIMGMLFDLRKPKLHWDNEQQAVKQNMNVVYNMLAAVIMAVMVVAVFTGLIFTPLRDWIIVSLLVTLCSAVAVLLYFLLKKRSNKMIEKIVY
jgi:ABC-2 type transport system permease protein